MICFKANKMINLQGVDVCFIFEKYENKVKRTLNSDGFDKLKEVYINLKQMPDGEKKDNLLQQAISLKILDSDILFKMFLLRLVEENILYSKKEVLKIISSYDEDILNFHKQDYIKDNCVDLVRYRYELNCFKLMQLLIKKIEKYILFSSCTLNTKYVISEKEKIIKEFEMMGI